MQVVAMFLLVLAFPVSNAVAQALHLPPPVVQEVKEGVTLLTLTPPATAPASVVAPASAFQRGATFSLSSGRLTITLPGKMTEFVPLGNQSIADFCNLFKARYPGAGAVPHRPDVHTRFLGDVHGTVGASNPITFTSRASAYAALGAVYALRDGSSDSEGLLDAAGLHLDLVGETRQLVLRDGVSAAFTFRLGLYANSPEAVVTTADSDGDDAKSDSALIGETIESANQVAITGGASITTGVAWSILSVEFSQVWTSLDEFEFPILLIGDSVESTAASEAFAPDIFDDAVRQLDKTIPTFAGFLDWTVRAPGRGRQKFYAGIGIGRREHVKRSITYSPMPAPSDSTMQVIDGRSLSARVEEPTDYAYRLRLGFDMGVIALRAESVAPIDRDDFDPLIRIAIAKKFALTN